MKTVEETRHDRLLMLRDEYGSVAELAKKLEKSYAQVSQWINRSVSTRNGQPRSMNSETVRDIELKTNKPRGWMDQPVYENQDKNSEKPMVNTEDYSMEKIEFIKELGPMNNQEFIATKGLFKAAGVVVKTGRKTKRIKGSEDTRD